MYIHLVLEHLQPCPRKASPGVFFAPALKKRPSRASRSPIFAGLGQNQRRRTQTEPGALGGAWGRRGEWFWREKAARLVFTRSIGSRGESMASLPPPGSLAIDSSQAARHGTARRRLPSLARIHTGATRLYKPMASPACGHTSPALAAAEPFLSLSQAPPPSPSLSLPSPMAEHFPGDEAATNGFGRRSLREQESWLLFQANIPAPPDMRAGPTGWRLSNGGVPIPPLPDAVNKPSYFADEVEIMRVSLTDAELSLPQYAADNTAAWAAYFQRRQQRRLASTNGAPVVGSLKNNEGRHLWWGVPGRTLDGVLTHIEGGNNPPLAYPPARTGAPAHRRRDGQWAPRRFGSSSSSSSSRSSSQSSGTPSLLGVKPSPWRRRRSAAYTQRRHRHQRGRPARLLVGSSPALRQAEAGAGSRAGEAGAGAAGAGEDGARRGRARRRRGP